ncbi:DUF192 domain-containing protein [Falsirhodobacter halotolerans]|uniref:DUF192 domain-containing protein n=1 Tax=Falsirhodobacter halotolerans TaxID=1146892 RepID=UPI001FD3F02D|nr:DUF192 domain-containing protein [Falsirhodobacter halotolerans]MCJ8139822.1 DUF192 domain-containing protein [Falsirhodobacter halotolerans]
MKAIACLLCLIMTPVSAFAACRADQVELRTPTQTLRFHVEVADTVQSRAQGLMGRETMAQSAGMLFVYERPQPASFWMKNTLIPLDMVFTDETGTVRHVHSMAQPHDETPIPGGDEVLTVLEINGGLATKLGIEEGAMLRHPAIPQDTAAWPCE